MVALLVIQIIHIENILVSYIGSLLNAAICLFLRQLTGITDGQDKVQINIRSAFHVPAIHYTAFLPNIHFTY